MSNHPARRPYVGRVWPNRPIHVFEPKLQPFHYQFLFKILMATKITPKSHNLGENQFSPPNCAQCRIIGYKCMRPKIVVLLQSSSRVECNIFWCTFPTFSIFVRSTTQLCFGGGENSIAHPVAVAFQKLSKNQAF